MEIREIKEKLSIGEVLAYYGYEPTKTGLLKCRWHEETDPKKKRKKTLQVYYDSNRFQCFKEGCVGNGDVIDFIQHEEKCDKPGLCNRIVKWGAQSFNIGEDSLQPRPPFCG